MRILVAALISLAAFAIDAVAQSRCISLNGTWDIVLEEGEHIHSGWTSRAPVPGIASQAVPSLGKSLHGTDGEISYDAVWYRTTFDLDDIPDYSPELFPRISLKLRARYNCTVYLNGAMVGRDEMSSYSSCTFDLKDVIPSGNNEIVIRVGSWNEASYPSRETKAEWWRCSRCPGINGDVSLLLGQELEIAEPRIDPQPDNDVCVVRAALVNHSQKDIRCIPKAEVFSTNALDYDVRPTVASQTGSSITVHPGDSAEITLTIPAKTLETWKPYPSERQVLYELSLAADYDGRTAISSTDFGYRSYEIVGEEVLVNGRRRLFNAENIALNRAVLKWADQMYDQRWIESFLYTISRKYNINYLRMHLGHAYDGWYRAADKLGIMIQDEWPFMHASEPHGRDSLQTVSEFRRWICDNYNHPSIFGWDMENEGDVSLESLVVEMKSYDRTRPWPEDEFSTQHRYEYSECLASAPYIENGDGRPVTVLESCRFWINGDGKLATTESFKTSRTASLWGLYYYTPEMLEDLQCSIHRDIATKYKLLRVQAFAPFALLSGDINGQNMFIGNIADSLSPKKCLVQMSEFYREIGASIDTEQSREWYLEKTIYRTGKRFRKPLVVWNDTEKELSFKTGVTLSLDGRVVRRKERKVSLGAFEACSIDGICSFMLPVKKGVYVVTPWIIRDGIITDYPSIRIRVGEKGQMQLEDFSHPFPGSVSLLQNFTDITIPKEVESAVIGLTSGYAIDRIETGKDDRWHVAFSSYESGKKVRGTVIVDNNGNVVETKIRRPNGAEELSHTK